MRRVAPRPYSPASRPAGASAPALGWHTVALPRWALARLVGLGAAAATLAAGFFVTFPFHYQVVPWAGALFHPLVTALTLGALLAYREARVHGGAHWWALSLGCALLALFTQEYAVTL